jgi:hypothetical protein
MAKKKIRLTESQLIDLIKKSMVSEQAPANTIVKLDDATLRDVAKRVVDLMLGDVQNSDVEKIQEILQDEVFGTASARTGKCAYKQFDKFYASKAAEEEGLFDGTGNTGSLKGDLEAADIESDAVKNELVALINDENKFCRTLETPVTTTPSQTATSNKFPCAEKVQGWQAYTGAEFPNPYATMPWSGGIITYFLNGQDIPGAPTGNNIQYVKGNKKWTTQGSCGTGAPGEKPLGLNLGSWTVLTN